MATTLVGDHAAGREGAAERAPARGTTRGARATGLAGLAAAALLVANEVFLGDTPAPTDGAATVAHFFRAHGAQALATAALQVMAAAFFVAFVLGLTRLLRQTEGAQAPERRLKLAVQAAVLGAGLIAARYLLEGALAGVIAAHTSTGLVGAMYQLGLRLALVGYLALGVCLLAVAVAGRRRGAGLPRWCNWIGGLGGGALVVSIGSLAAPASPLGLCGFLGLILLVLWLLSAGGTLLARLP